MALVLAVDESLALALDPPLLEEPLAFAFDSPGAEESWACALDSTLCIETWPCARNSTLGADLLVEAGVLAPTWADTRADASVSTLEEELWV